MATKPLCKPKSDFNLTQRLNGQQGDRTITREERTNTETSPSSVRRGTKLKPTLRIRRVYALQNDAELVIAALRLLLGYPETSQGRMPTWRIRRDDHLLANPVEGDEIIMSARDGRLGVKNGSTSEATHHSGTTAEDCHLKVCFDGTDDGQRMTKRDNNH